MRRTVLLFALAASALVLAAPATAGVRVMNANSLEAAVVARINTVRASHGLVKLRTAPRLKSAATKHSASMASRGFFSHSWANGAPFERWIGRFWPGPGYSSWSAGENLFWASPDTSARAVVAAWMASPGHRANILNAGWRQLGVGAVRASNPVGVFRGNGRVVLVAAEFGRRS